MVYKTYDELPLFIDAKTVSSVLGISRSGAYELMHQKSFPTLKIGARIVVPKEEQEICRKICESVGATLRIRPYEG